jgi:NAD+ synthase
MNSKAIADYIVAWLGDYLAESGARGFVVGISGGVDSAAVSLLAAMTGAPVLAVSLPIHQPASHLARANEHSALLRERFWNVRTVTADLTAPFDAFVVSVEAGGQETWGEWEALDERETWGGRAPDERRRELTGGNTRARLRMTALYYYAGMEGFLVVGTGNKIEDFGVGFFTKYGDGGVDISPIGDLTKTEVYSLADYLGVPQSITRAKPADGLFDDDRSDEDQIGATYPELEWAMEQAESGVPVESFSGRLREVYDIYLRRHRANRHKMDPIPVCQIPPELKV